MQPEHFSAEFRPDIGRDWMLITARKPNGKINTMTAAWGGTGFLWNVPVVFVFIRPKRYTFEFVEQAELFSLSFFEEKHRDDLMLLGTVSGRDGDKIGKTGLTLTAESSIPYFREATDVLLCRKLYRTELKEEDFLLREWVEKQYPLRDFHVLYIGEIMERLHKTGEEHLSFPAAL